MSPVLPWLVELGRNLPGAFLADGRTRERVLLAVAEVDGSAWCGWARDGWAAYLGDVADAEVDHEAVVDYARACVQAGRGVDPGALAATLPPGGVAAVRAVIAQAELTSTAGRHAARLFGRRPAPMRVATDALVLAVTWPVAAPVLATAGVARLVARLAPPMPSVQTPDDDANLLAHLLARTVPAYLANATVRLAVLGLPVPLRIGVRTGRSEATVRIGRRRIEVSNGIAGDAVVVLEGDIEPLLQLAAGTMLRDLATLRLRRD